MGSRHSARDCCSTLTKPKRGEGDSRKAGGSRGHMEIPETTPMSPRCTHVLGRPGLSAPP